MVFSRSSRSRIRDVMRAEGDVLPFPTKPVEARARFDTFFQEEHERLFKALYFVTGNRPDAEELMQDAFLKLWERWDSIHEIEDPTGYLFRVALNGFGLGRCLRLSWADLPKPRFEGFPHGCSPICMRETEPHLCLAAWIRWISFGETQHVALIGRSHDIVVTHAHRFDRRPRPDDPDEVLVRDGNQHVAPVARLALVVQSDSGVLELDDFSRPHPGPDRAPSSSHPGDVPTPSPLNPLCRRAALTESSFAFAVWTRSNEG